MSTDFVVQVLGKTSEEDLELKGKGKKRTRSSLRLKVSAGSAFKKSKAQSSGPSVIQANHALNHYFYSKEQVDQMIDFKAKAIVAEKKVHQQALAMFNTLDMLHQSGYVEMALFPTQYNESLIREFYANLNEGVEKSHRQFYGVVNVRGIVVAFPPANIAELLCCPHYVEIEGTGIEGVADQDHVAGVLTGDVVSAWPDTNRLPVSKILPAYNALSDCVVEIGSLPPMSLLC